MEKTNYEFLDELDLSLIQTSKREKWVGIFKEFMESDQKYCLISFANEQERKLCKASLGRLKRKNNLQIVYGDYGNRIQIYISKA